MNVLIKVVHIESLSPIIDVMHIHNIMMASKYSTVHLLSILLFTLHVCWALPLLFQLYAHYIGILP